MLYRTGAVIGTFILTTMIGCSHEVSKYNMKNTQKYDIIENYYYDSFIRRMVKTSQTPEKPIKNCEKYIVK